MTTGVEIPPQQAGLTKEQAESELYRWLQLKEAAARLVAQERSLRAALFKHFFPAPVEGTNTYELPKGYKLKGKYPIERTPDEALVATLRALQVGQLSPADRETLHVAPGTPPDTPVTEALRLNVDELLRFKPELATTAYRKLTAEQYLFFDRCLTIKPGSPAMEIVEPKDTKA